MIGFAMATRHARSEFGLIGFIVLVGCATAPVTATMDSAPSATGTPKASPVRAQTSKTIAPGDAFAIDGPDGLVSLCESLRDEASMTFSGGPVEQARALEAHSQRRQAALTRRYVTIVPAAGFDFRSYDLGERRLVLDTERTFAVGDGAELFVPTRDPAPGFALTPESADRIARARASGSIDLRLIFRPAQSELRKNACVWLGGGRIVKLGVELVAYALIAPDGSALARGDAGDYADASAGGPVATPQVTVHKPRTADGRDLPKSATASLAGLAEKAQPCYEQALRTSPALRGTLVLAIRLGAGDKIEAAHVEMSSLGNDALASCVAASATKTKLQAMGAGQRLSVPLQFGSADDR